MQDTLVWILVVAGAMIGLLSIFLFSSERELRRRRAQVNQLLAKADQAISPSNEKEPEDRPAPAQLSSRVQELVHEISALSAKLQASEEISTELTNAQERLSTVTAENSDLRLANEQLQREMDELRNQLESNQAHMAAVRSEAERGAELLEEVTGLKDKLEQSQAEVQRLSNAHDQLAEARARELIAAEQQRRLERDRADVEGELAAAREELESVRSNIQAAATGRDQLEEEVLGLRQDLAACRERIAQFEAERQWLHTTRRKLDGLRGKHAACFDAHQSLEKALSTLALALDDLAAGPIAVDRSMSALLDDGAVNGADELAPVISVSDSPPLLLAHGDNSADVPSMPVPEVKRRRFGLFSS